MFTCKICNKEFKNISGLSIHLSKSHKIILPKNYYDIWIKQNEDGKCQICHKETQYGVEYNFQREKFKKKYNKICLEKYGVENASQNIDIYNKGLKTRRLIHKYKDTNLTYQGSYELDFLEKNYIKFPDIKRGPSIKYKVNGRNKVYHPDFYIPSQNLIIEIKSSYILTLDENFEAKKEATISSGFNYLMILDKNYSEL